MSEKLLLIRELITDLSNYTATRNSMRENLYSRVGLVINIFMLPDHHPWSLFLAFAKQLWKNYIHNSFLKFFSQSANNILINYITIITFNSLILINWLERFSSNIMNFWGLQDVLTISNEDFKRLSRMEIYMRSKDKSLPYSENTELLEISLRGTLM